MQSQENQDIRWELPIQMPPPPRRIRLTRAGWVAHFVAFILFPALALFVSVLQANDVARMQTLFNSGKEVLGLVANKYSASGKSISYYVEYTAPGGISDRASVSKTDYDGYTVGTPTLVTIDPANPQNHVLGPVDRARMDRVRNGALGVDLVCVVGAILIMIVLEAALWNDYKFARFGQVLPARIIRVIPKGQTGTLYYEYQMPGGAVVRALARCHGPSRFMGMGTTEVLFLASSHRKTRLAAGLTYIVPQLRATT